jgi:hypothetical protein
VLGVHVVGLEQRPVNISSQCRLRLLRLSRRTSMGSGSSIRASLPWGRGRPAGRSAGRCGSG